MEPSYKDFNVKIRQKSNRNRNSANELSIDRMCRWTLIKIDQNGLKK